MVNFEQYRVTVAQIEILDVVIEELKQIASGMEENDD